MAITEGNVSRPFFFRCWEDEFDYPSFSPLPSSALFSPSETSVFTARVDWKETPNAHVFKADLPGMKKEEVKVEVVPVDDGNKLQISGERTRDNVEKTDTWHRVERSSGKFMRRIPLPKNVKMDQIKASMENGVLTVTVPKKEREVKSIEISD